MKAVEPELAALNKCSIKGFALCSNQRANAFNGVIRNHGNSVFIESSKGVATVSVRRGFVEEAGLLEPFDRSRRV